MTALRENQHIGYQPVNGLWYLCQSVTIDTLDPKQYM